MKSMSIDTHFHIFDKNAINPANSRYSVSNSALLEDWFALSRAQGVTKGVIVQPSFLGTDNSFLIAAIKEHPELLKGVAVVGPSIAKDDLRALKKQGISGVRLNLCENPTPLEALAQHQALLHQLVELGMHLELHHDDGLLNTLLLNIPSGLQIVIDHFGRPKSNIEFSIETKGIDRHRDNIWVKLSAPYRTSLIDHQAIYQYWLNKIGSSRLLWGSDWPHTQFESQQNYASQLQALSMLCQPPTLREQILSRNPTSLYWS